MANVQRSSRVGGNEFDLYFFTLADFAATETLTPFQYQTDNVERGLLVNKKIDKTNEPIPVEKSDATTEKPAEKTGTTHGCPE